MTKKDFNLIAKLLLVTKPAIKSDQGALEQWEWIVETFASTLSMTNPRFDRDKFKRACGL